MVCLLLMLLLCVLLFNVAAGAAVGVGAVVLARVVVVWCGCCRR